MSLFLISAILPYQSFNHSRLMYNQVRLGVQGWRERYYEEKFTAKSVEEMEQIRRDVVSFPCV